MIAPTIERTPSEMPSTKPSSVVSLRGRNIAAATTSATQEPMHRPVTGSSPTAVAKSTPSKKPPAYIMPKIENTISTTMGTIRSNTRPFSEMLSPLYSSMAPDAASSMSASSVTTDGTPGWSPSYASTFFSERRVAETAARALPSRGMSSASCPWAQASSAARIEP